MSRSANDAQGRGWSRLAHWFPYAPTREGIGFLIVASCLLASSFIQRTNLLLFIFSLMVAPVILGVWWSRRMLRGITARRSLPAESFAATACDIVYEVRNAANGLLALGVNVTEMGRDGARIWTGACGPISPGECCKVHRSFVPDHRGRMDLCRLRLSTRMPLGLIETWRDVNVEERLWIYPAIGRLSERWRPSAGQATAAMSSGKGSLSRLATHGEWRGLRGYRAGDNPRHIHWRTSARRGVLMVKEFDAPESTDLALWIEPWMPENPSSGDRERVERLIEFAATVCLTWSRWPGRGFSLAIAAVRPVVLIGKTGRGRIEESLQALAEASGSSTSSWKRLLELDQLTFPHSGSLVLASTRPANASHEQLLTKLGDIRGRLAVETLDASSGDLDRCFVPEAENSTRRKEWRDAS